MLLLLVEMESFECIEKALESWLSEISILEERQQIINNYKEQITRTLQQIQIEGLTSIYDFTVLSYIGQTWISLVEQFSSPQIDKRIVIQNLLKLYNANQISSSLLIEIIAQLDVER